MSDPITDKTPEEYEGTGLTQEEAEASKRRGLPSRGLPTVLWSQFKFDPTFARMSCGCPACADGFLSPDIDPTHNNAYLNVVFCYTCGASFEITEFGDQAYVDEARPKDGTRADDVALLPDPVIPGYTRIPWSYFEERKPWLDGRRTTCPACEIEGALELEWSPTKVNRVKNVALCAQCGIAFHIVEFGDQAHSEDARPSDGTWVDDDKTFESQC